MNRDYSKSILSNGKKAKSNYGFYKGEFKVDESRINIDYIKGIVDSDGHLSNNTKGRYRVVISQSFPEYILSLKNFIDKEFNIIGKIYMNGTQLNYYDEKLFNIMKSNNIIDYDSYFAGFIDGDGSFCRKSNGNGKFYSRLIFGFAKQRKINILYLLFKYYNISSYSCIKKNNNQQFFSIDNEDDLLKILEKIRFKIIIKNFVSNEIYNLILNLMNNRTHICKYCQKSYKIKKCGRKTINSHCDDIICHRKYNNEKMHKLRLNKKLGEII